MHRKTYKGRCQKKTLSKSRDVVRAYSDIQFAYADVLEGREDIREIQSNVPLDGIEDGGYVSDFVCIRTDGDYMVRECVQRQYLTKPMTVRLLDLSRVYWQRRGITDWGIVIDAQR